MRVIQPFRNPGDYACFRSGVEACAALFGHKVDAQSWGGGLPGDLTLVPIEPDVYESESQKVDVEAEAKKIEEESDPSGQ